MNHIVDLLISLLMNISLILGVSHTPPEHLGIWQLKEHSTNTYPFSVYTVSTSELKCEGNEKIVFPAMFHSAHELYADHKLVSSWGKMKFDGYQSFFGRFEVPCNRLSTSNTIEWHVSSYSNFFFRFKNQPFISKKSISIFNIISISMAMLSGFIFLIMAFLNREINRLRFGFILLSIYSILSSSSVNLEMVLAHKIADLCLWIGLVINFSHYLYKWKLRIYTYFCFLPLLIFAKTGDGIQAISSLAFIPALVIMFTILYLNKTTLVLIGTLILVPLIINDLLSIFGLIEAPIIFPVALTLLFSFNLKKIV